MRGHGMMSKLLGIAGCFLMVIASAHAQDLRMQVQGDLLIDPQGRVSEYNVTTAISPEAKALLDRSVRQWTFEPPTRQGQPIYARTRLDLTLAAIKSKDGYQLQVQQIRFTGSRKARRMEPPHYPMEAARAGISADVLIAVRVDAQGRVLDVAPVQTSLPYRNATERDVANWSRVFEKSAVAAARRWTYEPADPRTEDSEATLIVPVDYRADATPRANEGWRRDVASPAQRIPWLNESEQQFDPTGLKEGESLVLGSSLKLTKNLVGSVL